MDKNKISTSAVDLWLLGDRPLIMHNLSVSEKNALLMPGKRVTREFQSPKQDFNESLYKYENDTHQTRLRLPSAALKSAMIDAAWSLAKPKREALLKCFWLEDQWMDVYGEPKVLATVIRYVHNTTPALRVAAVLPKWCCHARARFIDGEISLKTLLRVLSDAGVLIGLGSGRRSGNFARPPGAAEPYGTFIGLDGAAADKRLKTLTRKWGREAQDKAIATAKPYDKFTDGVLRAHDALRIRAA